MKYTTIESQGQKWLRPINAPYPNEDDQEEEGIFQLADAVLYKQMTADLLYIGSKPAGSTLDESEVREVRQFMIGGTIDMYDSIIEQGNWITMHDIDKARLESELPDFLKRTAYTDAESHDRHISESKCVAGCVHFEGGEVKHHNTCPYYPDSFTRMHDYWKRRCLAAEKYIAKSPCDPDIYEEQMVAHRRWQSIVKKEPK